MPADPVESAALDRLLAQAAPDPNVVAVILTGSQARPGMATPLSDIDAYVVLAAPDAGWQTVRTPEIDIPVCTVEQLRVIPGPSDDAWWDRYSFTHSRVLLDRSSGEIAGLIDAWGTLSGPESKVVLETYLDGYLNYVYRSLKSHRDGRIFEARLDAVESLVWGLPVIFAFERRIRPYNKYLAWELERYPLGRADWAAETLLPQLEMVLGSGDPTAQRTLFRSIEEAAREVGLDGIVDSWGEELAFLRNTQGP